VIDVLGLHVKVKTLALITLYRQPDNRVGGHRSTHLHFKEALGKMSEAIMQLPKPTPDIIVCGDFNRTQYGQRVELSQEYLRMNAS